MGQRLAGKNAVVTGSSLGIGREIALALAAEGAKVVVNSSGSGPQGSGTNFKPLNDVVDEIKSRGGVAIASFGSVTDFEYTGKLIQTCIENFGSIDILVNNAGITEIGTIMDVPLETWQRVIDVHLNGTFNCCRHACPLMAKQRSGRIINVSSHAFLGIYGGTGYAAAKGGIVSLTKAIATDMSEFGLTCNAICPAGKTRMSTGDEYDKWVSKLYARGLLTDAQKKFMQNPSEPDRVPPIVSYLATDEAANITGQVFTVWGGYIGLFLEPKEVGLVYQKQHLWTVDELMSLMPSKLSEYLPKSDSPGDSK